MNYCHVLSTALVKPRRLNDLFDKFKSNLTLACPTKLGRSARVDRRGEDEQIDQDRGFLSLDTKLFMAQPGEENTGSIILRLTE